MGAWVCVDVDVDIQPKGLEFFRLGDEADRKDKKRSLGIQNPIGVGTCYYRIPFVVRPPVSHRYFHTLIDVLVSLMDTIG